MKDEQQRGYKSVFDMSNKEFKEHLRPTTERIVKKALSAGLFVSYPSGTPNQFIHEYADGKRILIEIDLMTGKEHYLKTIS